MTGLSLASSRLVRAGHVHGLFPFGAGRMVTDGAARSGRRTPGPHVWLAAPLQFMRGDGWRGAAMSHQLDAAERFARGERVFLYELIPLWAAEELEAFVIIARMVQRFGGFEANRDDACRRILKNRGIVEGQPLPPEAVWPNEQLSRALNYDWGLGAKWDQVDKKVREVLVQPNIQTGFVDTKSDYGDIRECHHRMWARRRIGMPRPDVVDENGLFLKRLKVFGSESRQTWCAADIEVCARDPNSGNKPSQSLSTVVNRQEISRLVSEIPEAGPRKNPLRKWPDSALVVAAVDEDERRAQNQETLLDHGSRFKFLREKRGRDDELSFNHYKTVLMPEIRKLAEKRGVQLRGRGDSKK